MIAALLGLPLTFLFFSSLALARAMDPETTWSGGDVLIAWTIGLVLVTVSIWGVVQVVLWLVRR